MATQSLAAAAETFAHYLRVALTAAGTPITSDMEGELQDAVAAFRAADEHEQRVKTALPSAAAPR